MNALSHIDYSNRLPRGRSYANKGMVEDHQYEVLKLIMALKQVCNHPSPLINAIIIVLLPLINVKPVRLLPLIIVKHVH
jgi:SNF2 family DNA or RNA helicase